MTEIDLSAQQYEFLNIVSAFFLEYRDWPTMHYVDVALTRQELELEDIMQEFNDNHPDIFRLMLPGFRSEDNITLSVKALIYCNNTEHLLHEFVDVIRLCAFAYYMQIETTPEPIVESGNFLGADSAYTELIGKLIQENCYCFRSFSPLLHHYSEVLKRDVTPWRMTLSRDIKKYRNINNIEDFVKVRYLPAKTASSFIQNITALSKSGNQIASVTESSVFIPPAIQNSLSSFTAKYPDSSKVAFIIMRFAETDFHKEITATIKATLQTYGIIGLRADDQQFHEDTFQNIQTYMHGCGFGIAVFERIDNDEFNPNVALEVGYMLALSKPVCYLKEKTMKVLHADLMGKLYTSFKLQDISGTVNVALSKWLKDAHLLS